MSLVDVASTPDDSILLVNLIKKTVISDGHPEFASLQSDLAIIIETIVMGDFFTEPLAELISPLIPSMICCIADTVSACSENIPCYIIKGVSLVVSIVAACMGAMCDGDRLWTEFEAAAHTLLHTMICKYPSAAGALITLRHLVSIGKGYRDAILSLKHADGAIASTTSPIYLSRNERAFAVIANLVVQTCPRSLNSGHAFSSALAETRSSSWKLINEASANTVGASDDAYPPKVAELSLPSSQRTRCVLFKHGKFWYYRRKISDNEPLSRVSCIATCTTRRIHVYGCENN